MTDRPGTPESVATPSRAGQVYAVLAAVLAGLLLFLPILLVGFSFYVVAAVARGEGPASARRVGTQQAVRWLGRGLVVWHAGVAVIWASDGMSGTNPAGVGPC